MLQWSGKTALLSSLQPKQASQRQFEPHLTLGLRLLR
jgi:hypothetical protein